MVPVVFALCIAHFQADQFSRWRIHKVILDAFWFTEDFADVTEVPYSPLRNGLNDQFEARKIMHYSFKMGLPLEIDNGIL